MDVWLRERKGNERGLEHEAEIKREKPLFIDLSNADNSVPHQRLLEVMGRRLQGELKQFVETWLRDATVNVGGRRCRATGGIPQGSTISPLIFVHYLDEAVVKFIRV